MAKTEEGWGDGDDEGCNIGDKARGKKVTHCYLLLLPPAVVRQRCALWTRS